MAIDINNVSGTTTPKARGNGEAGDVGRDEATVGQQETSPPGSVDTVTVTDMSTRMQGIADELETLPVVDNSRVESVRTAIENGDYEVDAAAIAQEIITAEYGNV